MRTAVAGSSFVVLASSVFMCAHSHPSTVFDRYRLSTVATGLVKLQLNVITMGFHKQGVQQPSDMSQ